jgi:Carbohydrate binding module (family 6)/Calcineurin-like phosphoesterase
VPDTGDWQTWTTVVKTGVSLAAGTQAWRLVMDSEGPSGAVGNCNWIAVTAVGGGGGGTSTPFHGAPVALPGTIEAEDFDDGGTGVAYADTTPGNSGGQYRSTDVDIESLSEGGFSVGWGFAGEWLHYTVNVDTAGAYDIDVSVASDGAGGTFHIEVNGVDKTGPISVPNTGGWQTWATVRKTGVNLAAGVQVWRLVLDSNGPTTATGNFDWIRVTPSGAAGLLLTPGVVTASAATSWVEVATPFSQPIDAMSRMDLPSSSGGPSDAASAPLVVLIASLPGRIEAEDFDDGGEGVGYHDLTPANSGGQYRATGVDIEATSDTGGGFNVGWAVADEWLKYTVDVGAAGTYDLSVRVASAGAGGTFHIEIDGVDRTGPLVVPNTGSWQAWTTVRKTGVSLAGGTEVWRLVMDTNGPTTAVGNFNWIAAAVSPGVSGSTPFGGAPAPLPGTIQAENFDDGGPGIAFSDTTSQNSAGSFRSTAVDIEQTSDTSGGFDVGWAFAGEWLNYTVSVGTSGAYDIGVRVASNGTGGTFHLEVNGVDKTGPFTVPNTGDWQSWVTLRKTGIGLSSGTQVWRLVMDSNGSTTAVGNFNWISVTTAGGGGGSTPFGGSPGPLLPGTIQAEDFDEGGSGVAYVDTTTGNSGGQYRATDVDIEPSSRGGFNVGWGAAGEWLTYTVNVTVAGTYDIGVRVASAGAGGTFHIEVNGADKTGPLSVPNTGGWQTWTTVTKAGVSLAAGAQAWRLVLDTNGPTSAVGNMDWIRVSPAGITSIAIQRQPYLQQVTENSGIVVWTTAEPGTAAVRLVAPGGAVQVVPAVTQFFGTAQTGLSYDFFQHEARLTGLAAGAQYTYDVLMNGTDVLPGQGTLTTAPSTGNGPVRFIAFGDSGVGSPEQRQLAALMAADTFDLALHTGDVAYGTSDGLGQPTIRQYDDWVFGIYARFFGSRPFFPSIGNHDQDANNAQPYRDVFVLPDGGASATFPENAERFYSFDFGPVHFVALDTELSFTDPSRLQAELAWLEADLSGTAQPWKIAFFHRPPYNAGPHHGSALDVRQAFVPVFESHNVQLVLSSHQHDYERSIPWREFTTTGGKVVYLVTGGGGAPLQDSGTAPWTATSALVHHYVRVGVSGCLLQIQAVRIDGVVFDQSVIDRCAPPAPMPSAAIAAVPSTGWPSSLLYLAAAIVAARYAYSRSFFRRNPRIDPAPSASSTRAFGMSTLPT